MKFFAAKVDARKVKRTPRGEVQLSPLRFDYESEAFGLPVRLGLLNAKGKQDLLIYILHPTARFEAANYPNAFIPSNLEVSPKVKADFGNFYTNLFDATLAAHGGRAIVTEYAWQSTGCDPCPVDPLTAEELATFGADVLGGARRSWVLTRLHTRYDKDTLSEDLVFVQGSPVRGGRAEWSGTSAEKAGEVEPAARNNFQGRYIVRHPWRKKLTCDDPQYDHWGGPDGDLPANQMTDAAKQIAGASRKKVPLKRLIYSKVPKLKIKGRRVRRRR